MTSHSRGLLAATGLLLLAGAYIGLRLAVTFWPASWWFDAGPMRIADAREGEPVLIEWDRTIHRPFVGDWSVVVRRVAPRSLTVQCEARGVVDYLPTATLPEPLTLEWWTSGQCPALTPGRYRVSTIWTIRTPALGVNRQVVVTSNEFTIEEAKP